MPWPCVIANGTSPEHCSYSPKTHIDVVSKLTWTVSTSNRRTALLDISVNIHGAGVVVGLFEDPGHVVVLKRPGLGFLYEQKLRALYFEEFVQTVQRGLARKGVQNHSEKNRSRIFVHPAGKIGRD